MPRTTVEAVRALLAHTGYSFSDAEILQAISDASDNFVSGYDLFFSGVASDTVSGKLTDKHADFRTVKVGAWVRNETTGAETVVVSGPISRTAIPLEDDIFSAGDRYKVEDYARVEMAERYKAASLLVLNASAAARGISSATLGPARLEMGSLSDATVSNEFEKKFLEIVGPVAVA